MIVREQLGTFTLIRQHDHAQLSGWLAAHWGNQLVPPPPSPSEALVLATGLHDIGWEGLDDQPAWDEAGQTPVSFRELHPALRVPHYKLGIDQVAQQDDYAALLCSRHYGSFFPEGGEAAREEPVAQFLAGEREREKRLRVRLESAGRDKELARLSFDLGLLKLWDHLSLYVALNHPGVHKEDEYLWYRDGFPPTPLAYRESRSADRAELPLQLQARWLDGTRIALAPFPFEAELACTLALRIVTRAAISTLGMVAAYNQGQRHRQRFTFVPDPEGA